MEQLPDDIEQLCSIVGSAFIDYEIDQKFLSQNALNERKDEIRLRTVKDILEIIKQRNYDIKAGLVFEDRILANCRNMCLLMCSALRQKRIPARLRYTFVPYIYPFPEDHVLVEYWHHNSWHICDPWMHSVNTVKYKKIIDLNLIEFSNHVWVKCRNGQSKWVKYSFLERNEDQGRWYAINMLLYDFASLNGFEPCHGDIYIFGYIDKDKSTSKILWHNQQLELLDKLASFDIYGTSGWDSSRLLCTEYNILQRYDLLDGQLIKV